MRFHRGFGSALLLSMALSFGVALSFGAASSAFAADDDAHADHDHGDDDHAHGDDGHAHGDDAHGDGEHGDGEHGGHHAFNWYHGMLGTGDAGEEPTIWTRPPEMPVPFLAMIFNAVVLFGGFYFLGRRAVAEGLKRRRRQIMQGMDDAAKMLKEAGDQLRMYEERLASMDAEVERLRIEMREAASAERTHILAEAKARRERMERDAKVLIEQELKAARETLLQETVRGAVDSAGRILAEQVTEQDQDRLQREYLGELREALSQSKRGAA